MSTSTRRRFLQQSTAGLAAAGAASLGSLPLTAQSQDRVAGANRRIRVGLIGCGGMGWADLRDAVRAGAQCVALCDVDDSQAAKVKENLAKNFDQAPELVVRDFRRVLDRKDIDAVIVATPDHWHALNTIDALRAGAHVFVEKPTGHSVNESRAMLQAARDTGRIVQVGLHRRVGPHHVSAMEFLRSGAVGEVGMVRLFVHGGGGRENPQPNEEPSESLDWNLWCGPAPLRPFNKKLHPGGWRNFLDYGNGTLGDWGVHWLDQVLLWTEEKYPKRVFCTGGRPIKGEPVNDERGQTTDAPDHQVATYEFEQFTCIWEHRQFAANSPDKHRIGAYFYGTQGTLHIGWRDGWTFYPSRQSQKVIHEESQLQEPDGHNLQLLWADFIRAIDLGKQPAGDIESAHRASVLPLLGMISWRIGRSIEWDGEREVIRNDSEASGLLSKPFREPWVYPA